MKNIDPLDVQNYTSGAPFPCDRMELIQYAKHHGADEHTTAALRSLPIDRFESPDQIGQAIAYL